MSQFLEFDTVFADLKCLLDTLVAGGFKREHIEHHAEPQNLYGYHSDMRNEKAHVIIRRKHIGPVSNDIGFERMPNGTYKARISQFDTGAHGQEWLDKLQQEYGVRVAIKKARAKGMSKVRQVVEEDGSIRLVFRRAG